MQSDNATLRNFLSKDLMDVLIRVSLIAFVVVICVRVFAPFMGLVLWALILAVALYPLHQRLAKRFDGRQGRAATLVVVAGLLLIGVPTSMLGSSFASHAHNTYTALDNNTIEFKQPDPAVAEWPVVGKKIHAAWSLAADNLPAFLKKNQPQIENFTKYVLSLAASTAGGLLLFIGALIVAGIIMAYGESGIGRGVDAPMPVILLGAMGGMVSSGIIGLFIGAVMLAVGYQIFMSWVDEGEESATAESGQTEATA